MNTPLTHQAANQAPARLTYRIDRGDVIAAVDDAWAPFARANEAPHLADVLGRPLWDYVSDDTTRQVYRDLLARVRAGHDVTFPYRCDAPALRRFMRMTMRPAPERGVVFESDVIRTEARPVPRSPSNGSASSPAGLRRR